jgi:amino-acid N-acetyltransferase
MDDITFAAASAEDLSAIRALLEQCGLPTADLRDAMLELFTVCRIGGRIVGTIGLEVFAETALLRSLAVAPEHRGRRLAHDLWARVRDRARRGGIRRLYLLTTTAEPLFFRWGFRRVARDEVPAAVQATREYNALCPSTAAVMAIDVETLDQRGG